jgi:Tfp pilus assembly protein PilO
MNLNKRQQLLAILAIVAVGLFVADKLVITPLTKNWKARAARITELEQEVREGADLTKREATLREQWERMRTNTLAVGKTEAEAKSEAEGQMLNAFERWSKEGGVSVSSIRPQWKEAEADYKTLQCRADVGGNLAAIAKFLYQIERDPLGVKVDSLELTTRNVDGSQLALVIQVSGLLLNPPRNTTR